MKGIDMKNPLSGRTKEQAQLDAERLKQRLKDMEQTKAELRVRNLKSVRSPCSELARVIFVGFILGCIYTLQCGLLGPLLLGAGVLR
jgi:hypothetical protein